MSAQLTRSQEECAQLVLAWVKLIPDTMSEGDVWKSLLVFAQYLCHHYGVPLDEVLQSVQPVKH